MKLLAAGLIAAAMAGAAAAGAAAMRGPAGDQGVRTVVIRIDHSRFGPSGLDIEPGERVRFVIRNTDPIDHEFILGDEDVQARHENGTEPEHGEIPGEVSVAAGAQATTTYTFARRGSLIFGCHLPGHYRYGMRGIVRIV